LSPDQLRPYTGCLYCFAGDQVEVRGHLELRTTFTWERRFEPVGDVLEREIGGKTFKLGKSLGQAAHDQIVEVIA